MQYRDFPLGMRILLVGSLLFFAVNLIIFLASAAAIAGVLAERGVHPSFWTLAGTVLGAGGALFVTKHVANENRKKEAVDVAVSLHAEIADRAARCLNDYLDPWQKFQSERYDQEKIPPRPWVSKFRPVDPVVYPAVASKLGLLHPDALFPIVQFYFRLDALRREIDDILVDESFFSQTKFNKVKRRVSRVADRMQSALGPAAVALSKLNIAGAERVESAAALAYPHVRKDPHSLRSGLTQKEVTAERVVDSSATEG